MSNQAEARSLRYELKAYQFMLEATTPIAHHQETIGNQAIAFRRKIRQPGGGWAHVPVVTSDTMRHALREAIAYAFLDAAGMLNTAALSEAALRLLFAGGMVTGRGDGSAVKLDQYHEMCELVPALSLLGGCASNRVIPGRVIVEDAILVCAEARHQIAPWVLAEAGEIDSCRAHIELEQRVRMDPSLDPGKLKLLSAGQAEDVQTKLLRSEDAHDNDNPVEREATKSTMMPRTFERLASGSLFAWNVQATCLSDLDVDTFNTMCAALLANCRVGGKRGTGHGLLRAVKAQGVILNQPDERLHPIDTTQLAPKTGELFRSHVRERAEKIKTFLSTVNA